MKLYIIWYQNEFLFGIYSTEEKARERYRAVAKEHNKRFYAGYGISENPDNPEWGQLEIQEWELDKDQDNL